jgi:carboxyl-terminal processing protease
LRRHLVNDLAVEDKEVEVDSVEDPRFALTADDLKKQGIEDFQLHYAMQTLERLGSKTLKMAETETKVKVRKP